MSTLLVETSLVHKFGLQFGGSASGNASNIKGAAKHHRCLSHPQSETAPLYDQNKSGLISPPQTVDEQYAAQLSRLASQHHCSEYSRLKFGAQGCPFPYIPISIQMPAYYRELVASQMQNSLLPAWHPCADDSIPDAQSTVSSPTPVILGPRGIESTTGDEEHEAMSPSDKVDLRDEISAAMASPLESKPSEPLPPLSKLPASKITNESTSRQLVKTSGTHPINISAIIPSMHLPTVSLHISPKTRNSNCSPTLFDIPPSHTLDRVVMSSPHSTPAPPPTPPISTSLDTAPPLMTALSSPAAFPELRPVSEAITSAINSGLSCVPAARTRRSIDLGKTIERASATRSTASSNRWTIQSTAMMFPSTPLLLRSTPRSALTHMLLSSLSSSSQAVARRASLVPSSSLTQLALLSMPAATLPTPLPPWPPSSHGTMSLIGNLYMSSCPGKKVRLAGPVRGRNTVCRDVKADLRRFWEVGVRCVICCLDDSELAFLGVPWGEYERAAKEIKLAVLRIPMPEGLAPISSASLDTYLCEVIERYTLQGKDVLVHCRGGVGRAGVVAACWVLRLGMCGWIETELRGQVGKPAQRQRGQELVVQQPKSVGEDDGCGEGAALVRRDTLQTVERAIAVVRRRRSIKAVETFEQVKFLVEYVEFLRMRSRRVC